MAFCTSPAFVPNVFTLSDMARMATSVSRAASSVSPPTLLMRAAENEVAVSM